MAVLGAEQIQELQITPRYFDKYIVAVNMGAAIAKLILTFTYTTENRYYIVYVVGLVALALATVLFLIGWKYYRHVKPYDSVTTKCIPVVFNAFQTRRQYRKNRQSVVHEGGRPSVSNPLNAVQNAPEGSELTGINQQRSAFFDFAKVPNGGKLQDRIVEDVRSLRSVIAVFIFFIPYFIIYSQARPLNT